MLESEKFAIAAHLHVLLRRTNGRVTDVEWMIKSPEYAREVIRVARTETHADLHKLADKLEAAVGAVPPVAARPSMATTAAATAAGRPAQPSGFGATEPGADSSGFAASSGFAQSGFDPAVARKRYVGTLR
ncbi:MAG: hypothetical protein HY836_12030 [Aquabacterium sp.]|uniref:hypothetical protein n=1 Tax=Aquabacterium sp. TaxID=1872578 RepID=UPI0025BA89CA|nr:hypothetical protein [Aquabacterium sp.]MBI5926317.1 hypothetical protein [Aquabacterium sp.]